MQVIPAKTTSLYSEALGNEALGQTVRAIPAKTDKFATNITGGGEDTVLAQWKAWKDNDMSGWQVDRYDYFNGTGKDAVVQKKVMHRGISFFDALRVLSECEHMKATSLHQAPKEDTDGVHWSDAAKEAGQAVDIDNLVVPCAYGKILVDANVTGAQLDIAAQSEKPKEETGRALVPSFAKSLIDNAPVTAVARTMDDGVEDAGLYAAAVKAGRLVIDDFRCITHNIDDHGPPRWLRKLFSNLSRSAAATLGAVTVTVPIAGGEVAWGIGLATALFSAAAAGASQPGFSRHASLHSAINDFRKAAAKLPDGDEKVAALQFAREAHFAGHMIEAKVLFDKETSRDTRKAKNEVLKAAQAMKFTDTQQTRLLDNFLKKGDAYSTNYAKEIKQQWDTYLGPVLVLT